MQTDNYAYAGKILLSLMQRKPYNPLFDKDLWGFCQTKTVSFLIYLGLLAVGSEDTGTVTFFSDFFFFFSRFLGLLSPISNTSDLIQV